MNYRKAVCGNRNGVKGEICKCDEDCMVVGDIWAKSASMTRSYRSVPTGMEQVWGRPSHFHIPDRAHTTHQPR